MQPGIADKLHQLNHQFYQTFAESFSATRQRLQPGVLRILEQSSNAAILDLGCGSGELARELTRRNYRGAYLGLDFSEEMLVHARAENPLGTLFLQADLTDLDWDASLQPASYDYVLAFAVLHHLPGVEVRQRLLESVRALLALNGRFVHSNWQFLNSARLRARLQPWDALGLTDADVDPGDYLLDWRRDGYGLRYVHHFSEDELRALAAGSGFTVLESFISDGEGGDLGLYHMWKNP